MTEMTATTVVCPLTGNPPAERALPSAVDVADLLGASLELFSAVEDPHMVKDRVAYLETIDTRSRDSATGRALVEVVVDPHAPRAISERSAASDSMTVMATSSQPLMHVGYIGSAAERVARDAHNPVLLVGPHNTTRLRDVEQVVVPCDGSALSEAVLLEAAGWAKRLDLDLWVVTSLNPRKTKRTQDRPVSETNYVRRLAEPVNAQWEVLHGSDPAKTIVQWAGSALIVMTTHGRSGLSRLTVGSVTAGVTRWASGPVLVSNGKQVTPTVENAPGEVRHQT